MACGGEAGGVGARTGLQRPRVRAATSWRVPATNIRTGIFVCGDPLYSAMLVRQVSRNKVVWLPSIDDWQRPRKQNRNSEV